MQLAVREICRSPAKAGADLLTVVPGNSLGDGLLPSQETRNFGRNT